MNEYSLIIGLSGMDLEDSETEAEVKYSKVYKPFLRELYKFPEIKAVLHFSGVLLEWFEDKHPEVIMLLEELVKKRKQVEILGGGFYEPILPMLSPQDRSGQLEALTTLLRKKFGKRPRGCWITGNIWDNSLVLSVKNSGMDYVFLDYDYLDNAYSNDEDLYNPFITEDSGKLITVFPVHNSLASLEEQDVNNYLGIIKSKCSSSMRVASLIFTDNDMEKRSEEWIEKFFSGIQSDREIKVINPGIYLKNVTKLKKIYIQNINYYKKSLTDNYAINLLYARMTHVQTLVNQIRGDKYKKKSAVESLWAAQNYIAYIGNHYGSSEIENKKRNRNRTYRNLIEAELLTRQKGVFISSLFKNDFDMDGSDEFLYQGEDYNAFTHAEGAALFELDYLKGMWNYCDVVDYNCSKPCFKKSFVDYMVKSDKADGLSIKDFVENDAAGITEKDFLVSSFDRDQKSVAFSLKLKNAENDFSIKIVKKYRFLKKKFEVNYSITNTGSTVINHTFGVGIFLTMLYENADGMNKNGISGNELVLEDSISCITIKSKENALFLMENEICGECYCYTSVMTVCKIDSLEPGKSWENVISLEF